MSVLLIDIVLVQLKLNNGAMIVAFVVPLAIAIVFNWLFRTKPDYWKLSSVVINVFIVQFVTLLLFPRLIDDDLEYAPRGPVVITVVVAVTVGLALMSFLLARHAARLVLTELSHDVVNSRLVIAFKSRADRDTVLVTPDSIDLLYRHKSDRPSLAMVDVAYALADVSAVTVRRQGSQLKYYPVPRMEIRETRITKGYYVEIDLSGETFVFPAKDCQRFARFVEDRCRALVRDE